ncbi:hypothetical protein N431DRAFT_499901 [Stipitochalara longipes BDJ]|nr:hypothetical protein N431DRAFT_499901 [Stipitochalara longipes BDJ]
MSDAYSPSKRRKTKGPYMKFKKPLRLTWPPGLLPVEIFTLIIDYLPRSSIQNLRLVNKEFDWKVSQVLFEVVVVPFRPEIYGITPDNTPTNDGPQSSVMLQDKGMRVFQGFGRWIQKFAMSFEIDPEKLANPPVKCDQEAIVSFWGIYRWPYKTYNRYSQLEGLEQTADETRSMAKALKFVVSAKELGLSIDGGLGWLAGPDINQRVLDRGQKLSVFGKSRFLPEPKNIPSKQPTNRERRAEAIAAQPGTMRAAFERMLQEAGYLGENLEPSIRMMLENEAADENNQWEARSWDNFAARSAGSAGSDTLPASVTSTENWRLLTRRRGNAVASRAAPLDEDADSSSLSSDDDDSNEQLESAIAISCKAKVKAESVPLKPNDLTNAQREMLLEMEWAQEAFMQSYVIAVIDNRKTFENIQSLNFARLPSRHLAILRREDFWESLPKVEKLSLGIIPDWRKVVKEETSWVQDTRIAPSLSIAGVYQLLCDQISERASITDLHFEWLCGGEYDVGLFARNQHVMAAPLVSEATHMVNRAHEHTLLALPHIQHLSLKNCWISPHIMVKFMMSLRESALESLTLDSVSLTGSIAPNAQPGPLTQAGVAQNPPNPLNPQNQQNAGGLPNFNLLAVNVPPVGQPPALAQLAQNALAQPPPVPLVNNQPNTVNDFLQPPRPGSWAAIIDELTPGITLEDLRYSRDNPGQDPLAKEPSTFTKITLESCGYVRLPLDFDQAIIDPPRAHTPLPALVTKRIADFDPCMMKSHDAHLGVIVNHISAAESGTLQNAWNMTTDWGSSRQELFLDSRADGVSNPGSGRLSGVIEVTRPAASNSYN